MASLETLITPDLLTFSLLAGTEALDITITSPLCPAILGESCHQAGAAEASKLHSNGPKCQELGWSCIPLAVETYGNWGKEAQDTISRLASHLAIHQSSPKSSVVAEIYGRLNIAPALLPILARELPPFSPSWPGSSHPPPHPGLGAPTLLPILAWELPPSSPSWPGSSCPPPHPGQGAPALLPILARELPPSSPSWPGSSHSPPHPGQGAPTLLPILNIENSYFTTWNK